MGTEVGAGTATVDGKGTWSVPRKQAEAVPSPRLLRPRCRLRCGRSARLCGAGWRARPPEKALFLRALGRPGPREETEPEAPRLWERLWENPKLTATVLAVVKGYTWGRKPPKRRGGRADGQGLRPDRRARAHKPAVSAQGKSHGRRGGSVSLPCPGLTPRHLPPSHHPPPLAASSPRLETAVTVSGRPAGQECHEPSRGVSRGFRREGPLGRWQQRPGTVSPHPQAREVR